VVPAHGDSEEMHVVKAGAELSMSVRRHLRAFLELSVKISWRDTVVVLVLMAS
jgi:hypothetical protein